MYTKLEYLRFAALGVCTLAAAWTDYGGDADERGMAITLVQAGALLGPPAFGNAPTIGSRFDQADVCCVRRPASKEAP